MSIAVPVPTEHKDLIHDVALDYYGRRMATCSSDQSVKIWDLQDDMQWKCMANWKTHAGSVWKVTWAHPLYGQLIATCSFDRTAALWEETVGDGSSVAQSHWVKKATFVDSRLSVTDVQFAPKHLGLQIVTTSGDGILRIYENIDQSNLSQWQTLHEFPSKLTAVSCVAWSQSRSHPTLLAVGSDSEEYSTGKVFIFELIDNGRKWMKVESLNSIMDPVHDLTFANALGRSFHTLAIASKDLYIISITPSRRSASVSSFNSQQAQQVQIPLRPYDIRMMGQFKDHRSRVWRISWNITGTILASSGDDGCIRLWRANHEGIWRSMAVIKGDGSLQSDNDSHKNSRKSSLAENVIVFSTQGENMLRYPRLKNGSGSGFALIQPSK